MTSEELKKLEELCEKTGDNTIFTDHSTFRTAIPELISHIRILQAMVDGYEATNHKFMEMEDQVRRLGLGIDWERDFVVLQSKLTATESKLQIAREALEKSDRLITDGWSVQARDLIRETLAALEKADND